jgi:hypothetical protein
MEALADEYCSDERVDPNFREREYSQDANLIEAWKIIANMTNRLRFLETLYLQRFNYRPRGECHGLIINIRIAVTQ